MAINNMVLKNVSYLKWIYINSPFFNRTHIYSTYGVLICVRLDKKHNRLSEFSITSVYTLSGDPLFKVIYSNLLIQANPVMHGKFFWDNQQNR